MSLEFKKGQNVLIVGGKYDMTMGLILKNYKDSDSYLVQVNTGNEIKLKSSELLTFGKQIQQSIIGDENEEYSDILFIEREKEKPGYEFLAGNYDFRLDDSRYCAMKKYQWAELKSSALVYFLNKNDSTHNQLVKYIEEIINKVLLYLGKNMDTELKEYQEKIKTSNQGDTIDLYPVAQIKAYTFSDLNVIKKNFYMMYNFLKYIWYIMTLPNPKNIEECTDNNLTIYFIINLLQQGIMSIIEMTKSKRKYSNEQNMSLQYPQSIQIGISNLINDRIKRTLRDFPNYQIIPWLHPGRVQCRVPYRGKYGKYMKEYSINNEYEASLQCGISGSVQFILYMYLLSIAKDGTRNPKRDVSFTLISGIMMLVGDGGHNIREIITGFTVSIIVLYNFMKDLKEELQIATGKTNFKDFNILTLDSSIIQILFTETKLFSEIYTFIINKLEQIYQKITTNLQSIIDDSELYDKYILEDSYKLHIIRKILEISEIDIYHKAIIIFNQLLLSFGNWENYINEFYNLTKDINPLGVYMEDLNQYDKSILKSKEESLNKAKKIMYHAIFYSPYPYTIDYNNTAQIFFALEGNRYKLDQNSSFKKSPDDLVKKELIKLSESPQSNVRDLTKGSFGNVIRKASSVIGGVPYFKDVLNDVNTLIQTQIDRCKQGDIAINIPLAFKSKSPKRKSPKRKSPKRRSPKRKSPKRRSPKRRSPKRRSPKRRSPKRKSPKRKSPKRKDKR